MAYRCLDESAPGRRLCRDHQRRLDRGGGLPTAAERFPGDPSGHGIFGVVDRSTDGVLCHECGERFDRLGPHVQRAHHTNVATYRRDHGISAADSLAMPPTPDGRPWRKPRPCRRCKVELITWGKLCAHCSQRRQQELHRRRNPELYPQPPKWRTLTKNEQEELLTATAEELPPLITRLQHERVPSKVIGETLGHAPAWMSRHHPRPGWGRKEQD